MLRVLYHSALDFSLSREFYHDENVWAAGTIVQKTEKDSTCVSTKVLLQHVSMCVRVFL